MPHLTPAPTTRALTVADLDQVLRLEQDLFGIGAWSRLNFDSELRAPSRHYVVLEAGGVVVGYAGVALALTSQVMTIGVHPAHRGRGYGDLLLADLLEAADAAGSVEVILEVRVDAEIPQALYRKWGFVTIGMRKNYYQAEGVDALVMRKNLRGVGPLGSEVLP